MERNLNLPEDKSSQFKRERPSGEYSVEKLILGTHTSDNEQNHLMIAEIRIPSENAEVDASKYNDIGTDFCSSNNSSSNCLLFFE